MVNIIDKSACCGCSACATVCPVKCIDMKEDEEGFLYPVVNKEICIHCDACDKVCPILQCKPDSKSTQKAFLMRTKDDAVCKQSTSGGAFSAIAEWVISRHGVVFGAAFNNNFEVHHTFVEDVQGLQIFRNSKYVQSRIEDSYSKVKTFLSEKRLVLFSGTPCQVEGLYHFLKGKCDNLILVDTVCRAVPSPLVWRMYKEYSKPNAKTDLVEAIFRDKSKYGYQYSQMKMAYSDGSIQYSGVESDPYLRAFFSNLSDRPSCYDCKFKKRYHVSDLTIWDCFDAYRFDKNFDDNRGVTRVLSHSKKGERLVSDITNCDIAEIGVEVAIKNVHELVFSVDQNPNRSAFFQDCSRLSSNKLFEKWFPDNNKTKLERVFRYYLIKLGIYRYIKRFVHILVKK